MYFKSKIGEASLSLLRGYKNITIGRIAIITCFDGYTKKFLETRTLYGLCKIFISMRA